MAARCACWMWRWRAGSRTSSTLRASSVKCAEPVLQNTGRNLRTGRSQIFGKTWIPGTDGYSHVVTANSEGVTAPWIPASHCAGPSRFVLDQIDTHPNQAARAKSPRWVSRNSPPCWALPICRVARSALSSTCTTGPYPGSYPQLPAWVIAVCSASLETGDRYVSIEVGDRRSTAPISPPACPLADNQWSRRTVAAPILKSMSLKQLNLELA